MRRARPFRRTTGEPTIPLINVVFLMLVFFLVAGTLERPLSPDLALVRTASLDAAAPPDALVLHADGRLTWRGAPATVAAYAAEAGAVARIVPDRRSGGLEFRGDIEEPQRLGIPGGALAIRQNLSETVGKPAGVSRPCPTSARRLPPSHELQQSTGE